jgi:phosphatidylglycerophosphate synthase
MAASAVSTAEVDVAYVVGDDDVRLWGLAGGERLARQLRAAGVSRVLHGDAAPPSAGTVVVLRSDYLFEDRTIVDLLRRPGVVLVASGANGTRPATAVAAHVPCSALGNTRDALAAGHSPAIPGVAIESPESLSTAFIRKLHKAMPPVVLPVRAEHAAALERHLFDGSYKGVTDLVTKWVWPAPARAVTRLCARFGIPPNAVTAVSFTLVVLATVLFAQGRFAYGLVLAWIMTFLDTVDGKLARVTVTSTRFGHYFDHSIDSVHPPIWYLAWGWGVTGGPPAFWELGPLLAAILVFYVAGRLIETAFKRWVGSATLFTWRPFDSYFRLVMARRNPNLILLTAFFLGGAPRAGLVAVGVWTVLSTIVLAVRFLQGVYARSRLGVLRPWLEEIGDDRAAVAAWARPFVADLAAVRHLVH